MTQQEKIAVLPAVDEVLANMEAFNAQTVMLIAVKHRVSLELLFAALNELAELEGV